MNPEPPRTCTCEMCRLAARIEAATAGTPEEVRATMRHLLGLYISADEDATYWKMRHEGTWPDGRQHTLLDAAREAYNFLNGWLGHERAEGRETDPDAERAFAMLGTFTDRFYPPEPPKS
jgi:hypothetical protein